MKLNKQTIRLNYNDFDEVRNQKIINNILNSCNPRQLNEIWTAERLPIGSDAISCNFGLEQLTAKVGQQKLLSFGFRIAQKLLKQTFASPQYNSLLDVMSKHDPACVFGGN